MNNLDIIYEDDDIILCRKPAGMATQTKRIGQQDMESLLKNYRAKKKESPYIGVVHRLDQPVEGIMVFAKNQKAAAGLSKQIQQRMIGKHYYAVSKYKPKEMEGKLEDYLITDKRTNVTSVFEKNPQATSGRLQEKGNAQEAKKAILEYKVQAQVDEEALFDITLHTGRQHQIRVQMAHMGCTLIGDSKYGEGDKGTLALCSYRLCFMHPKTGKQMDFSIKPNSEVFQKFFARIEK